MHENMNLIKPLTGTVEKKLDKFGDIIYAFGSERFGVEKRKEQTTNYSWNVRQQQKI